MEHDSECSPCFRRDKIPQYSSTSELFSLSITQEILKVNPPCVHAAVGTTGWNVKFWRGLRRLVGDPNHPVTNVVNPIINPNITIDGW
jgi:hypothetical protein